jgi:AcrR family transcriptional regulator
MKTIRKSSPSVYDVFVSTAIKTVPATRKPRVKASVAQDRLIVAAIDLLREIPIREVTSRRVASAAGVSPRVISRQFGSMVGLFDAVTKRLSEHFASQAPSLSPLELLTQPDLVLRSRLIAWLIGEGVDPARMRQRPQSDARLAMVNRFTTDLDVSPHTSRIYAEIMAYLSEGFTIFHDTHVDIDESMIRDASRLIDFFRRSLPVAERELGWSSTEF